MIEWRIGCSGFYNKHWKGVFYPEALPQSKWLSFYAEHLNSLELNVTFYRFPTLELMQGWYKKSPENFIFSVKAPRIITHYKQFIDCKELLNDFYNVCEIGLKNKLGCLLFQLPPSIQFSEGKLEEIVESLHPGFRNVIEFRHVSWWNKKVFDILSDQKITFCSVSHPTMPASIITTTPIIYVRLHGVPKMFYSDYKFEELEKLFSIIEDKKNIKKAYVYFNNTAGLSGILNALDFIKMSKLVNK